ncbi:MAG: lysine--tRNA ligase [Gammaproteobacteria bacterium]|jgi:lysyl-tRNA synthetase, class II|nr:lysine--tRNA ligase [Gammaproteobacteria bacterium]MBT7372015.1 lysine--tRNA ligase [Gammaproteobacteria bacterium]
MTEEKELDENEIVALRKARLAELRSKGNAFPNDFRRQHLALQLHEKFGDQSKEDLEAAGVKTAVAGRIVLRRLMGKASFVTLQDVSGRIQLYIRQDDIGKDDYEEFKSWDIGDIVGAAGTLMKTNKGELTVNVSQIRLLTKSLRPLPEKHKGLTDTETRYRQRYLDLIVNEHSRELFIKRSQIVDGIRRYLIDHAFMEVETPMMQSIPGGATAAPFQTYYNALDTHMYLRVAPELNLKRLVVGGFERVFEINRNFRNEGMSTKHSPEFTMLEFYWAYADYNDLMDMTEAMLRKLATGILGSTEFVYNNVTIDLGKPFTRMTMGEALIEFNPSLSKEDLQDYDKARALAERVGIEVQESWGLGKLVMELFEELVEDKIEQPIFITEHPTEVSPLARRSDENPDVTDRFELFVMGKEIANGFSELNDAEDQAERFKQQVAAKDAGDDEAMHYDEDYITALEYGLPPTAGEGLGIDRLVMLFTDSASIRDVVLFPHMRSK